MNCSSTIAQQQSAGGFRARTSDASRLQLDERSIRRNAREHGPRWPAPLIVIHQALSEWRLRLVHGIRFRQRANQAACSAYAEMRLADFASINACQAWANWRTIPRNLSGHLPLRPTTMIDLCCGIGQSTEVLAYYAPSGSRIIGLEINGLLAEEAGRRLGRGRGACRVEFSRQSILETFRDASGTPVPDGACGLVNASGAVACHFDAEACAILLRETARVLEPGGLALIDDEGYGNDAGPLRAAAERQGLRWVGTARSCPLDRTRQLRFVRSDDSQDRSGPSHR